MYIREQTLVLNTDKCFILCILKIHVELKEEDTLYGI